MAEGYDAYYSPAISEQDRQAAMARALMMAAAQAFQSNDGRPFSSILGNTMFSGVRGYDEGLGQALIKKKADFEAQKHAFELAKAEREAKKEEERTKLYSGILGDQQPQAPAFSPGSVQSQAFSPQANAQLPPPPAPTPIPPAAQAQRAKYLQAADQAMKIGDEKAADRFIKMAKAVEEEWDTTPRYDEKGQGFVLSKLGGKKSLDVKARDEIVRDDMGSDFLYRTKYSLDPVGTAKKGMSPSEQDTSSRGWANINLSKSQFDRGRQSYDSDRGGIVNLDSGEMRPVTQGGQPIPPKMDAAQKKELGDIDAQIRIVQGAKEAAQSTPDAFGMKRGLATMAGPIPESVAGRFDSGDQRNARAYVFNVVSKVINERAGAAQSKQELARLRSFLPAETDNAAQIADKLTGFEQYLSDIRSSRSQPVTATPPQAASKAPRPGTVEDGYVFRGGDPGDKRNWMKAN